MPIPNPLENKEKEHIRTMFDEIAKTYDRLNFFLSFSIDKKWRRKLVGQVSRTQNYHWLDVSTGTADLAILAGKKTKSTIIGVDISEKMLELGRKKIRKEQMEDRIELINADAEDLPFQEATFDICSVSFGVRNFEHLGKGLSEIYRCLKPNGITYILEFSKPKLFPFAQLHSLYTQKILPLVGKIISKNNSAYAYLPSSIQKFPDGEDFLKILSEIGFVNTKRIRLTFGTATLYMGEKSEC